VHFFSTALFSSCCGNSKLKTLLKAKKLWGLDALGLLAYERKER
jgi:hypothetical protein